MKNTSKGLRRLVALIGLLLTIWMLRAAETVLIPLVVAGIIVILVWPLQSRLERLLPRWLSVVLTLFAILLALAVLGTILWVCAGEVASKADQYRRLFSEFVDRLDTTLTHYRLPALLSHVNTNHIVDRVMSLVGSFAEGTYQFAGFVVLVIVFVVLLLVEVTPFSFRLRERWEKEKAERMMDMVRSTTNSIQRFLLTRTLTSTIVGLLAGLFTWGIGLDFPLVWAVLSFILNYVPVLGAIVAVIPPTLVALLHPGSLWLTLVTLGGLAVIHFAVGNYVDPLLQGYYLSLPPFLIFYGVVFWGWLWGIPGAALGVPLTVGLVHACQHFEGTRWLAKLLLNH